MLQRTQNLWPDPAEAKSVEEFHKQYTEHYGRAMAFKEIFSMLETADEMARNLAKQKAKTKDKSYAI